MLKHLKEAKRDLNLNVKVNREQMDQMVKLAKKYADGSLSAWVRYAACKHVPPKAELKE